MEPTIPEFGRFAEPSLLILVSLSDGPKHGYAIMTDVEQATGRPLGPGTLYAALSRLEERGLIEALPPEERRRPYRLTAVGATESHRTTPWPVGIRPARPPPARPDRAMRTLLIRCYPAAWRERYGDEFEAVLEERPLGPFDVADVLLGALDARLRMRNRRAGLDRTKGVQHVAPHRWHRRDPRGSDPVVRVVPGFWPRGRRGHVASFAGLLLLIGLGPPARGDRRPHGVPGAGPPGPVLGGLRVAHGRHDHRDSSDSSAPGSVKTVSGTSGPWGS